MKGHTLTYGLPAKESVELMVYYHIVGLSSKIQISSYPTQLQPLNYSTWAIAS
jgi:hypothetical protein